MRFLNSSPKIMSSSNVCAIILSGLITGVLQVVLSTSYAVLIYGGKLSPYVGQGLGLALFGAMIIALIISLFSQLPGTVGGNQDVSVAIFSLISISIVASMPPDAPVENIFFTVVTTIALTVYLTGLFLFGLGVFRIGGLVRYFPYPVVGGFLAGTGWLLFTGGFSIVGQEISIYNLLQPVSLIYWLPSLLFAVIMLMLVQYFKNNFIMPWILLTGFLLFYGTAWLCGVTISDLSEKGWLLGSLPDGVLIQPFSISKIALADWGVIYGQTANIVTVFTVSAIALLLNASAFELETKQDVNLNKELRLAGIANVLSSVSPGFVGFRQLALSVLNFRMGAQHRIVGMIAAFVISMTLFFGAPVIAYFPKPIMSGLLMYLGLTFLVEWAVKTWVTMPRIDFAIIWLVLIVIATFGFMPGVAVGLMAALIMFTVSFSRTEVVRHELTGINYQSLTPRRSDQRQLLDNEGGQLHILLLQGFIFFGTAYRLLNRVRNRVNDSVMKNVQYIILDFQRVEILDSTGILSFRRLHDFLNISGIHLLITAPSARIRQQLTRGGLSPSDTFLSYFNSLDEGLEWCEEEILRKANKAQLGPPSLVQQRLHTHRNNNRINYLLKYMERFDIPSGTRIFRKGDRAGDFFFIESGHVRTKEIEPHGPLVNLETMRNGRLVGDIGFYMEMTRSADVVAVTNCVAYRLTAEKLKELEKKNPEIAMLLHQTVANLLAERVSHLVRTVNALQR